MAPHSYWHQPQLFLTTRWRVASPLQLGICGTGAKTNKGDDRPASVVGVSPLRHRHP